MPITDSSITTSINPPGDAPKKSTDTNNFSDIYFVVDYITAPAKLNKEDYSEYTFENSAHLDDVTSGTILGLKVDQNMSKSTGDLTVYVLIPFASHESRPVKPGEYVWAVKNAVGRLSWMARAATTSKYEGVNLSTPERKTIENKETKQSTKDKATTKKTSPPAPDEANKSFPVFTSSKSVPPGLIDFYSAIDSQYFIGEVVPRLPTKGPDYSIQGSNNTAVILTTDTENGTRLASGAIDIVVGRGQTELTAPPEIVENDRGFEEIVRTLNSEQNENEGEPDFVNDSSRVYVSMDTSADAKFGITTVPNLSDADAITTTSAQGPCVASKTTNQIMIARAEGSIRIIHESGSNIIMDSDGNIQIKCGPDGQIRIGATNTEGQHVIRGNELVDAIDNFANEIDAALGTAGGTMPLGAAVGNIGVALASFQLIHDACDDFKRDARLALSAKVQTE